MNPLNLYGIPASLPDGLIDFYRNEYFGIDRSTYLNPLEKHLKDVVNKCWNYAGKAKSWQDEVMNAVLGLAGEAGEVADLHKKMFYHSEKDRTLELINELGDVCYYLVKVMDLHGITLEQVLAANKEKLMARYAEFFKRSK